MMKYPAILTKDTNDTLLVTFPDVPEAVTFGADETEALARASDALETAFMAYIEDRRPIPDASPIESAGQRSVTLPVLSEAKIALYRAMIAGRIRKTELARRLGIHPPQVDRLLDLSHSSKIEQIEAALLAAGKRLTIDIRDAA
jgi:antitoxin HicB